MSGETPAELPVIDVRGVSYGYGATPALVDVSLAVPPGAFLGIIGPNGSGKTTLLELMLGLRQPDRGSVTLFGEPATEFQAGERIGYVAQASPHRAETMPVTVEEVVTMGRFARSGLGPLGPGDREAVADALETVGIASLADRRLSQLSGGQRQRTFIARALASEADLLALDEPTVGVDADARERFYDLLRRLNRDGITIVLIEHDIGVVTEHVDRVACLNRELYHHGDTSSFLASDALAAAYGESTRVVHHDH